MNRWLTIAAGMAVGLAAVLFTGGCGRPHEAQASQATAAPAQELKAAPATPMDVKKVEMGGSTWQPEWDKIVEIALPPEMLSRQVPHDVRRFCPRFYDMAETDKRAFWAYFFQALAGAEAGLIPNIEARHAEIPEKDEVTGRRARTSGLLQLAYEDEKRYGCDFDWERDKALKIDDPERTILQPKNNLECGVKILDHQIIEQHKSLFSGTGYWAPLRPGTGGYRTFVKQMTNVPLACKVGERQIASR